MMFPAEAGEAGADIIGCALKTGSFAGGSLLAAMKTASHGRHAVWYNS
jgi:hypothetical protein